MYPTLGQVWTLSKHIDICRRLYNRLLTVVRDARTRGEWLSWQDLQALLPAWKRSTFPELQEVHSRVAAMAAKRLHANLASLAAKKRAGRKAGKLRFKGQGWYNSICYNQSGFNVEWDLGTIHLAKIGAIKTRFHRRIPAGLKIN